MNQVVRDIRYRFSLYDAVTKIIVINVAVFVTVSLIHVFYTLSGSDESMFIKIMDHLKVRPQFFQMIKQPWSLISYQFLHAGVMHIFFNMLVLFWMGKLFVEYLGEKKFVAVYFLGGIVGALFFMLSYNVFPIFKNNQFDTLEGASAAINAVLVAIAVIIPNYTVFLMFIGPVKLKYLAGALILLFIIGLASSNAGGEFAHLGGALFGFIYGKQLQRGNDIGNWFTSIFARKKTSMKVEYRRKEKRIETDDDFKERKKFDQEIIDRILDKISKSGYESLSKEEKETLFRASDKK